MKKIWLLAGLVAAMSTNIHNAAAFSTDNAANVKADGSAKFSDPDKQMPGFMVAPDGAGAGNGMLSFGAPAENGPAVRDNDSGARAFDQAFAHQQDERITTDR